MIDVKLSPTTPAHDKPPTPHGLIERIIEYSIRNRFLVLILAAALTVAGIYAVLNTPVDATPDLSENQVIVFTDWMGRSPREIEDQVTYPLSRKLQGLAGVKAVRSSSEFNFSMITIIFNDDIDFYFARQRVTEKLAQASTFLPAGVVPYLAPDATALGQIFWYTVETSASQPMELSRLWALNKFYIAPQINAAAGVSDVAIVGGMPLEYQIDVRPEDLRAYGLTLGDLYSAVGSSNMPAGGGVIQKNNAEYIVRGVGWIKDKGDIEKTVIKEVNGTPIYVRNVASVQLGVQFRRSVYEKDGNEVVGGAVLMRHGQNPLTVTEAVKAKIQELQPGLPRGVHIVAAYDRTRLIHGAIHTLTEVMWHEMVIASLAVLVILFHFRSVFVICVTLPLAVLFSFLLMWVLRETGIIDIQANIMSLAGITISIGILVDQAIVMTENATHELKTHFGDRKVTGDIRELVIAPCRTVGRPIFFSVLIMLLSFVPVFMLSGREGKYFHPLAFTKSFAMIGVALISITVVPALIPTFIRGRLRSEEDNPIVRSFINIYKPLLTWALPRRNLVMWMFAVLLVMAAGMFPLQAVMGQGASETAWKTTFLIVFFVVTALTVIFTRGFHWQLLSFATLLLIGLWSFHFTKIGVAFMPALDEGTTLDMPVTVPRASVTQATDDLKARDALLRGFPEVESVVGKSGRADTPTDPAPLDMVETFVNFRPKAQWPKRVLKYADAARQTEAVLVALERESYVAATSGDDRQTLVNDTTQKALERFDETLRELALSRFRETERGLERELTRFAIQKTLDNAVAAERLTLPPQTTTATLVEELTTKFAPDYGYWLSRNPALEDLAQLSQWVVRSLKDQGIITNEVEALELHGSSFSRLSAAIREALGGQRPTLASELLNTLERHRDELWLAAVEQINWELFDRGVEAYTWYALQETAKAAEAQQLTQQAKQGDTTRRFAQASIRDQLNETVETGAYQPFAGLRSELEAGFKQQVFFWPRQTGPKGDLVDDEMGRVLQVPGWSNIFTQPIINRIEMLSTGVRTDIGVKVFGPDLNTIDRVCKEVESVLKPIPGARDAIAAPIMGKGYLQIDIDRERAARYGISVEDIQNEIEVALGGRAVTFTVEKRDRIPVRIRYARAQRDDEDSIRRLLVSAGGGMATPSMPALPGMSADSTQVASTDTAHIARPLHAGRGKSLIPLSAVADIKIVEGPAMIKSENGRLLNYVTLNVRGRDMVGFVDEAQRAVVQKVRLPEGVHLEWSGEFEHQIRAAKTLRIVFPTVVVLIFIILYLTYNDLADAGLMMLAVPEALAGGAFFMFLFPKIMAWDWNAPPMDFSVAVWVGFIACFGMATETGIIMLVYLREAIDKRGGLENIKSLEELRQAVIEGAVHRLRPKLLTEGVAIIAIFPMVFAKGVGGEILAPMALPVLGGLLISDEVVDLFLPVRFYWVRRARWLKLKRIPDEHPLRPQVSIGS
ncbi:MAG: efflux RND transporter permease subunit [Pirellulales bacterium]|nr:efflux RND transporter permease subunit [Pirellulales bacterium]